MVNKVAYMLSTLIDYECYSTMAVWWNLSVVLGLNHHDSAVRVQFPPVISVITVFLLQVPPRVKCRVLESLRLGDPQR